MSSFVARWRVILSLVLTVSGGGAAARAQSLDTQILYKNGLEAYEAADFDKAYILWKPLAEDGFAPAQYSLGKLFDEGGGSIRPNPFMAALWYRQAAAQDIAAAQNNLAIMYASGRGVPRDESRAVALWKKAADNGHAVAKFNLALSYFNGAGVPVDRSQAVSWFRRAASDGVADAQFALGQLYRHGIAVSQDHGLARGWYEKAASQGHRQAQSAFEGLEGVEPRFEPDATALQTAAAEAPSDAGASDTAASETPASAEDVAGNESGSGETAPAEAMETAETPPAPDPRQGPTAQSERPPLAALPTEDAEAPGPSSEPPEEGAAVPASEESAGEPPAEGVQAEDAAGAADGEAPDGLQGEEMAATGQAVSAWLPPAPRRKPQLALAAAADAAGRREETRAPAGAEHPAGAFGVWLATTANEAEAAAFWDLALDSYPEIFAGVEGLIRRVDLGDAGVNYRLLAGPLANRQEAREICRRLRQEQADAFCLVREN